MILFDYYALKFPFQYELLLDDIKLDIFQMLHICIKYIRLRY